MSVKRKNDYEFAFIEVTFFSDQDVITTSSADYTPTPGDGMNDDRWDT